MKVKVPWTSARQQAMQNAGLRERAGGQDALITLALREERWLDAGLLIEETILQRYHHAQGYLHPYNWWNARWPQHPTILMWKLRDAARAVRVVPNLAVLYQQGQLQLEDLVEAGKMAKHLHQPEDVAVIAMDRGARRAMAIQITKPRRALAPGAGGRRLAKLPKDFLDGLWQRIQAGYRAWGRKQPGRSKSSILHPSFAVVLVWLCQDWMRLAAAEKNAARKVMHAEPGGAYHRPGKGTQNFEARRANGETVAPCPLCSAAPSAESIEESECSSPT